MNSSQQPTGPITSEATPTKVFASNLDVDFVISFRYNKTSSTTDEVGNASTPEQQFQKLLLALDKAGLAVEVRDGQNGNLLVFVRIRSERKLLGEVYRSRYVCGKKNYQIETPALILLFNFMS